MNGNPPNLKPLTGLLPEIEEPRSYYNGKGGAATAELPGNVICFSRLSRERLGGGGGKMSHHRYVLLIAISGEGTVYVDAANFRMRTCSALLVLPYQYHSYSDLDEALEWLFVTFEAPQGQWAELGNAVHALGSLELQLLSEVAHCFHERRRHPLLRWHLALLMERVRFLPSHHRHDPEPAADLLVWVNQYALQNLHRTIRLAELASAIGLSESHLRAEFRQLTGKPLGGHLRYLRIQRASALLDTTDKTVSEIADECGFDSLFSFSRTFKALHGVSPNRYRRRGNFGA